MKINKVWAIYFSPVGNTEKIINSIADSIGKKLNAVVKKLDYTLPIFNGTGILDKLHKNADRLVQKIGLFPAMILITLISASIFCNQVVTIVMDNDFLGKAYKERGRSSYDIAMDIENSAITLPALIPWCILCTVPCSLLDVGYGSVFFGIYIYAVPLWTLVNKMRVRSYN